MIGEYYCNYLLRTGGVCSVYVGVPAVGLKDVMNIGKPRLVFLVRYVASRLALNLAFVENMLMDIM